MSRQIDSARPAPQPIEEAEIVGTPIGYSADRVAFVDSALDCIIAMDERGWIVDFNPAAEATFGFSRSEAIGRELAELIIPPAARAAHRRGLERFRRTGEGRMLGRRAEVTALCANGDEIPVEMTLTSVGSEGGITFTAFLRDVSDLKRTEERLRATEGKYRILVESLPAIVYTAEFGPEGKWSYVSPQIHSLLGFTPEEWEADPGLWYSRLHPDDRKSALEAEKRSEATGEPIRSEYRMIARDGRVVWFRDEAVLDADHGGRAQLHGVMFDVTDRRELEQRLSHEASHDSLTGLANRRLFLRKVQEALDESRGREGKPAVFFLDLDDFKTFNDSLGHAAGDDLLRAVAERVDGCLREQDTAARLGGDEFAVLVCNVRSEAEALTVARRIVDALRVPIAIDGRSISVPPSVGVAMAGEDCTDSESLLRDADVAMYTAKKGGRERLALFRLDMHAQVVERLNLKADLEEALSIGQLTLHYQPVVDLDSGRIVGVEALLRWLHPSRGFVPPSEFMPVAEDSGLIGRLTEWVLHEACIQAAEWVTSLGPGAPDVSVNVSAHDMTPRLVNVVSGALYESGLDPAKLVLELTESALMHNVEAGAQLLGELKALGVRLALDDFGTGYSSLGYLQRLSIDVLKIDRSFVARMLERPEDRALVGVMVQLASTFRLTAVAEGLESPTQIEQVRNLGCGLGQGFFFSPALSPTDVSRVLQEGPYEVKFGD